MNLCINNKLQSEVNIRRNEVKIGTELVYSDHHNYQKVIVTDVNEDSFAFIEWDGEPDYKDFDTLQIGWKFL